MVLIAPMCKIDEKSKPPKPLVPVLRYVIKNKEVISPSFIF